MATQIQIAPVGSPPWREGKEIATQVFSQTLAGIDVHHTMLRKVRREGEALMAGSESVSLARPPRVVAIGKAANRMAAALHEILNGQIERGLVVSPALPAKPLPAFRYIQGGHPYPTAGSLEGAEAALELVSGLSETDLVIFLISGGGSSLFEKPLDPAMTLPELIEFYRVLVTSGLPIQEMNVIRKHLSAVKGGRLALAALPARQVTIYISDVPEGMDFVVASGPTMPDPSSPEDCYAIVQRYELMEKFPPSVREYFKSQTLPAAPKPEDPRFRPSKYFCLLSSQDAVAYARSVLEHAGFRCEAAPYPWDGDFRDVAEREMKTVEALAQKYPSEPVALVAGGEVTCPVTGSGLGGRNQAYALYAATKIAGRKLVALSAGTDGRDGNSPSAGAVADGLTVSRARALGLDPDRYLAESDSYYFFRTLGETIDVGFTDNNVRDLRLWLSFP